MNCIDPGRSVRRLFVAAFPPREVLDMLSAIPQPREPGVRWVPRARWHATLRFLGDTDPDVVVGRLGAVELLASTALLGPAVSRLGLDAMVVPVAGVDELAGVVAGVTADLGEPVDPRPFTGHLTLARLRRRAACGVTGTAATGSFEVDEVCLVNSCSGADGLRFEVLHRFPTR